VLQFSTVIGTYLFAMGVGSWLSRYFERELPAHFLRIELLVALLGGALPAVLFMANATVPGRSGRCCTAWCWRWARWWGWRFRWSCASCGATCAQGPGQQVLTFDYLGALAVSLAFPLLLVPQLGLIRTGCCSA
jgi:spermidine synthase